MSKRKSIISGTRFNKLVVIKPVEPFGKKKQSLSLCQCDCGNRMVAANLRLKTGHTTSCGCYKPSYKHGLSRTKEYYVWSSMKSRCNNPTDKKYHIYGGKGIRVCERWQKFENFWTDMCPRPEGRLTIERVDSNGNYNPSNCVWATYTQQARNTSKNVVITFIGITMVLTEWAEFLKICPNTLSQRFIHGKTVEEAFFTPVRHCGERSRANKSLS